MKRLPPWLTALVMFSYVHASTAATQSPPTPRDRPSALLIVNAAIIDGAGTPARPGAVRIVGERIDAVGELQPQPGERIDAVGELQPQPGDRILDAAGLTLAPGFIDTHSHHDGGIFETPEALGAVSQGITTIVVGQDGGARHPLAEFLARYEQSPGAVNVASYAGHNVIRRKVLGERFQRAATPAEVEAMAALVREDMQAGALGLSTGLEYDPGIYADRGEVLALAQAAAAMGGRYISHIRSEDRAFWEAIDEILAIGRETRMPVQISHIKLAMKKLWGESGVLIDKLDRARAAGIDVTADIYPYPYWYSTLTVMFPQRDFEDRAEAQLVLDELAPPEGLLLARFAAQPEYAGKTVAEIAQMRRADPATTLLDLIRMARAHEERARAAGADGWGYSEGVIGTSMDEKDIAALMRWPHTNFCTDGELNGKHPRGYGSYPRVLGRYVREQGVLSLAEAIHKSTLLSARHMGLADRGVIAPGMVADLVLLDPRSVIDRATTSDPHATSTGVAKVWVNGALVWDGANATGARPGKVVKRNGQQAAAGKPASANE